MEGTVQQPVFPMDVPRKYKLYERIQGIVAGMLHPLESARCEDSIQLTSTGHCDDNYCTMDGALQYSGSRTCSHPLCTD